MTREDVFEWAKQELRLQITADIEWAKELRDRLGDLRYILGWSEYEDSIQKLLRGIKEMREDLIRYETAGEEAYVNACLVVTSGSKAEYIRTKTFYKALGILFNFGYFEFSAGDMYITEKSRHGNYYDVIKVTKVPESGWRLETADLIYRVYDFPVHN